VRAPAPTTGTAGTAGAAPKKGARRRKTVADVQNTLKATERFLTFFAPRNQP
jgi:hypothetical protein